MGKENSSQQRKGSLKGSVIGPMLKYIHASCLTLWFKLVVQRKCRKCFLVNFADDFVAGFQYKSEAERYYKVKKGTNGKVWTGAGK